jgi:4-hydroxybenzoate polyprenyltransferase
MSGGWYDVVLCRVLQRVIDLDRLVRVAYFGFSSTLVLLGAISLVLERGPNGLAAQLPGATVGGLLVVALAFHVFSYVQNDVIDLPVDRTQPKRARDPLVRGAIRPGLALAFALAQVPLAGLVSFRLDAPLLAYPVLLFGFGSMTLYNLYGKRCSWPPLTDLAQALGWASLTVYGGLAVDPARRSPDWVLVAAVAVFAVGFILLISGVHGGLRDLVNDRAHGRITTPLLFASGTDAATGEVISSRGTRLYAGALHAGMFLLPVLIVSDALPARFALGLELGTTERGYLAAVIALVFLGSRAVLARVVREREPRRNRFISMWGPVVMQAPLLSFAPGLAALPLTALLLAFYAPLLATTQLLTRLVRFVRPALAAHIEEPPSRPARARPVWGVPP